MNKTLLFLSLVNPIRGYSPTPLMTSLNPMLQRGKLHFSSSLISVGQSEMPSPVTNLFGNRLLKIQTYSTSSETSATVTSTTDDSQVSTICSVDDKSIELLIPQYTQDQDNIYRVTYSHFDGDSEIVNIATISSTGLRATNGKIVLENLISNIEYTIRIQSQKKESNTYDLVEELKVSTKSIAINSQSNKVRSLQKKKHLTC